jgi:sortase A
VGNFAVAGHRITHGEPFANLLKLNTGDMIIVETRTRIFTYRVDSPPRNLTVEDTEGWVIEPVPGHPDRKPTDELITLTTCQDLFHSPDRSVGFGHLVATKTK